MASLTAHDCALFGNNLNLRKKRKYTVQELPQQDFRFLYFYGFLDGFHGRCTRFQGRWRPFESAALLSYAFRRFSTCSLLNLRNLTDVRSPDHHKCDASTAVLCHVLAQSTANYPFDYSHTTRVIYGANYNTHCVWTCFIRIEFEFAKFAFNAHFNSHSCRQAFSYINNRLVRMYLICHSSKFCEISSIISNLQACI